MLLVFIFIGRVQELFGSLDVLYVGKIAVAFTLLLYFVGPKKLHSSIISYPQIKCIFGILILSIASVITSVWPGQSFGFLISHYFKVLLFLYLLINVIADSEDLVRIIYTLAFSMFLLSLIVCTMQGVERAYATSSYDSNDIAFVLVTSLPIVYFLMVNEKGTKKGWLFLMLIVMLQAVIKTASRGGFVGLVTVLILALFKDRNKNLLLKIIFFVALISTFLYLAPPEYWDRIWSMKSGLSEDGAVFGPSGRIDVWKRSISLIAHHPMSGIGVGAFTTAEGISHLDVGGKWSAAHNSFLQIGAELGIGGLVLFIALLFCSIKSIQGMLGRARRGGVLQKNIWLIEGLKISFYAYMVTGFFLSQAYAAILYFIVGCTIILKKLELAD